MTTCFTSLWQRCVLRRPNGLNRVAAATGAAFLAIATCIALPADAAIYAKYNFNDGNANDSAGHASGPHNGSVVDPGLITGFAGGSIDLRGNDGFTSGQGEGGTEFNQGAYVDLPNGIVNGASLAGTSLDLTFEIWFTEQTHRPWARLFDLGTSDGNGEGIVTSGANSDYILAVSGTGGGGAADVFTGETHTAGLGVRVPVQPDPQVDPPLPRPLVVGQAHHVALSLTQAGTSGAAGDNGTATLYHNGVSVGTAPIADGLFIDLMANDNNWLGRSQYGGDQLYDGTIDEFRIYDTALTGPQLLASFNTGPDPVPFPSLEVNRATGEITVRNTTTGDISLTGYSVLSGDGAMNIAGWDSIQPDAGWTRTSQTSTDASEQGGTAQVIAAGGSLSLGNLWFQTPLEDINFDFTTTGASGAGAVTFVGDPIARSDLDGNGLINIADWSIFLANNETPLNETTLVGAYRKGDLDGDMDNDRGDFLIFKGDFINANGPEAFRALAGVVPEPSVLALCGIAVAAGMLRRRRIT